MLQSANKVLDSDNKQLNEECKALREVSLSIYIPFRDAQLTRSIFPYLRQSLESLEEAFEQKILADHTSADDANGSPLLQDVATLRQAMKDSQKRHEVRNVVSSFRGACSNLWPFVVGDGTDEEETY